jgi:hypothetical protein
MNKIVRNIGLLVIALLAVTSIASAAGPRPQRGDVTGATPDVVNATWVTGVSQDGGAKGQSLALTNFAYYSFRNWWDQDLADVTKVRASFLASTTAVNSGGSPRFSLELDADANGTFDCPELGPCVNDVVVYLDPATCSDPVAGGWLEADFTGDRTNCTITDSSGATYTSDATGTAWSKLVAAYPDAKVWFMFLIQDATTGTNYVDRIMLDSAFFTKQP